jgi:UDP-N-acetylmuramoylalanine--D-glutamate ligase
MLILGAAVSGVSAARLGRNLDADVLIYDQRPDALADLEADGFATRSGEWDPALLDGVDVVIASPGIPEHAGPIQDAIASPAPLWSELELAARHISCRVVGVTGTNGKTTVTTLIAEMLSLSGLSAIALDVVVVEASSFQLRFVETFAPDVAVVLNVAPDHLDWHGSYDAYLEAKANLVARATDHTPLVFDADDTGAARIANGSRARLVPVSGSRCPQGGWGIDGDNLILDGLHMPLAEVPTADVAFRFDLVAAGTAALSAGARPDAVRSAIRSFRPGAHRRQMVADVGGVAWINDSKATNPHAASAAVSAYPSVVLIAGGRNKDLDLAPLLGHPNLRAVVAIGEAAPDVIRAARVPVREALTMEEAVGFAAEFACPGDTVLLAPGCTSWDMYSSYAERGEVFKEEVEKLIGEKV